MGNSVFVVNQLLICDLQVSYCYSAVLDMSSMLLGGDPYASQADYPLEAYGYLYNYAASVIACPPGWHLSSKEEWESLINYAVNIDENGCDGAKALASKVGWDQSSADCAVGNNPTSNNVTKFSALPAGINSISQSDYNASYPLVAIFRPGRYASFLYYSSENIGGNVIISYNSNTEPLGSTGIYMSSPATVIDLNASHYSVRCVRNHY